MGSPYIYDISRLRVKRNKTNNISLTQNQISINVKIAAADVCVRITLSYPKEGDVKIIQKLKIVVFSPQSVIILSTYQKVIIVYNVTVLPSGF
jgi:hypothetical protein